VYQAHKRVKSRVRSDRLIVGVDIQHQGDPGVYLGARRQSVNDDMS